MPSPIEATVILCDASAIDTATGKVHMLGAGWSLVGTPTPPGSVVILIQIPWDRTNERIAMDVRLCDDDGRPVEAGGAEVGVTTQFEAGRPPGIRPGSAINHPFELKYPPLSLAPGRYQWRAAIGDHLAVQSFTVRQP